VSERFDISLPELYEESWRKAYHTDEEMARLSSYQAPGGDPVPFIYKSLEFSGGQSVDTAEYPFFGLWSNETLNPRPQTITVHGYLRGEYYLRRRTAFVAALMVATSDDSPGFFDHPLWGRFKVVVTDYNIQEAGDENGQCGISLTLKRAGVSLDARGEAVQIPAFAKPKDVARIAVEEFETAAKDPNMLMQVFGAIKTQMLKVMGVIQAPVNTMNAITNEINSLSSLTAQGVRMPGQLAQAFVNAIFSIAAGVLEVGGAVGDAARNPVKYFTGQDSGKKTALMFLSAFGWSPPVEPATVRQAETKKAAENLYRTACLCAAADILSQTEWYTRKQLGEYWALYEKLETSVSLENPELYKAVTEMRLSLAAVLRQGTQKDELKKTLGNPVPLLFLSHFLGCDADRLRAMNAVADSFAVSGEVSYV
jgi:prophage DNA circulation protein